MQAEEIDLPASGWEPRDYQQAAWKAYEAGCKRFALAWHRRAGKDEIALHLTACSAFERIGNYWHMLPQASQSRKAIWDAVDPHTHKRRIDVAFPLALRASTREQDMMIKFINGSTWQVVGSDNYNSLVGSPPVGVVFSEYALSDPASWSYLRPILVENDGWGMFISSVRGRNHFWKMVEYALKDPDWFGQVLPNSVTKVIPQARINQELRELTAERGPKEAQAIVAQEYECDPDAALPGAYYGEQMTKAQREARIGDFPWMPHLAVGIASDLGFGDQSVHWFYQQLPNGRIRIIDVLAGSGVGIDWYARRIVSRPYVMVDAIWPHDGGHGNIRDVNDTTLKAQAEALHWPKIRVLDRDPTVDMGIQAVRGMLPLVEWNENPIPFEGETPDEAKERMGRAINAIRMYRREWDEKRQCFKDAPLHDWTSDYADALRYLARGRKPFRQVNQPNRPKAATTDYAIFG